MKAALYIVLALAGCALIVAGIASVSGPLAMVVAGSELIFIAYVVRYYDVRSSTNADS